MRLDLQDESYSQLQQPVKKSFCESLRRNMHWKCLILTLLIYGCLAAIIWCVSCNHHQPIKRQTNSVLMYRQQHEEDDANSRCKESYIYIPVACIVMVYLVYLLECWHCHTRIQLQYKVDVNTVYDRVQQMREALPIVWWKAVCFHYVRRNRQVTRYRNGDAFTSTQVYYERVNTHSASSAFNFTNCGMKDVSKTLVNLEKYPATKIRFTKGFSFTTRDAELEFEEQREEFFTEQRQDSYMETREGLDLINTHFKEHAIAFADPDNLPWYVSQVVFWVASLAILSWPLRVLIEYRTAHVRYHVHKLFGCNYLDSTFTPGLMSRVSTMGSMELEMNIKNNYSMVPSYSEAILMDSTNTQTDQNRNVTPSASYQNGYVLIQGNSYPMRSQSSSHYDMTVNSVQTFSAIQSNAHVNVPPYSSSATALNAPTTVSSRRNVLLHLPSTIHKMRDNYRRTWRSRSRPHSLAEVEPLVNRTQQQQHQQQQQQRPTRSVSMHSARMSRHNEQCNQQQRFISASQTNVALSISDEALAEEINQNRLEPNQCALQLHESRSQESCNRDSSASASDTRMQSQSSVIIHECVSDVPSTVEETTLAPVHHHRNYRLHYNVSMRSTSEQSHPDQPIHNPAVTEHQSLQQPRNCQLNTATHDISRDNENGVTRNKTALCVHYSAHAHPSNNTAAAYPHYSQGKNTSCLAPRYACAESASSSSAHAQPVLDRTNQLETEHSRVIIWRDLQARSTSPDRSRSSPDNCLTPESPPGYESALSMNKPCCNVVNEYSGSLIAHTSECCDRSAVCNIGSDCRRSVMMQSYRPPVRVSASNQINNSTDSDNSMSSCADVVDMSLVSMMETTL